jgi:hypothetical protein
MPIGQAINAGMGLLLQGHNDRRQIRQEGKLLEQQLGFDFRKMDKQAEIQQELWENTNYPAQVEQMQKAGLSAGLMYGLSGGGGTTTGAGATGVQGGKGPQGGNEILGMTMQQAQLDLMEAQAEKTEAEAEKISGVDTKEAETRIQSLTQGIENQKVNARLQRIQGDIGEIETEIKQGSFDDALDMIKYSAKQARIAAGLMENDKEISDQTKEAKIATVHGELIGLGLANELKRLDASLTEEQIKKTAAEVSQGWKKLSIDERNSLANMMNSKTAQKNANTSVREYIEQVRKNDMNYETQQDLLRLQEFIQDTPESTKLTVGTLGNILRAVTQRRGR